ncbi:MAG: hypothetical protein U0324_29020 [Polyangiales bacterium]
MARYEEDQPNRDLPAPAALDTHGQHWRVHVPAPNTSLLLGQRVPDGGEAEPAFGYPGVTVSTQAGFFADVHERTVWQGREVIAFQSLWNTEFHAGHAAVIGASRWKDDECEGPAGDAVKRTRAQGHLYGQLREQAIAMNAIGLTRAAIGVAKSIITFGFTKTAPLKVLGLVAGGASVALKGEALIGLTDDEVEPAAGVHVTSHDGLFLGADGSANVYARTGINLTSATTFGAFAPLTASLAAGGSAEVFGVAVASLSSTLSSEVVALRNSALIAKLGAAQVLGKTVQIGAQVHGPEIIKNIKTNRLYLRPTETLKLEALKSIEANVVGKFVINTPLGEVSSTSRKAAVKAVESVTLETPFGKVEINAKGITVSNPISSVKVDLLGVEITGGVAKVKVGPVGVNIQAPGGGVNVMPGGVVSVQGLIVKLG